MSVLDSLGALGTAAEAAVPQISMAKAGVWLAAVLAVVVGCLVIWLHIEGLNTDIANLKAEATRSQAQAEQLQASNDRFAQEAEAQNVAIDKLARLAEQNKKAGEARVAAVLNTPITLPAGHGPKVLNAWFGQP